MIWIQAIVNYITVCCYMQTRALRQFVIEDTCRMLIAQHVIPKYISHAIAVYYWAISVPAIIFAVNKLFTNDTLYKNIQFEKKYYKSYRAFDKLI